MKKDYKIIALVLITFIITIITSGLLEISFFQNPVRIILIIFLIIIEIYFALSIYKSFFN